MKDRYDYRQKPINQLHFIYSVCILGGAILLLLATILLDYSKTVATLSTSGILLSIVLAIVAILITLWDVAGQKNALGEIREQINSIKEITDDIKVSAESSKELVAELQDFDSRFGVNFDPIKQMLDSISDKIESPGNSNEVDGLKKAVEELRTMVNEKEKDLSQLKKSIDSDENYLPYPNVLEYALIFIGKLDRGEEFTRLSLKESVLGYSSVKDVKTIHLKRVVNGLLNTGIIKETEEKDVYMKI